MLADITVADRIYLITGYTDMRKSIDGLCAIIKDQMDTDQPDGRSLYLFCGKRRDRIKAILKEFLSADFCYPHIFLMQGCNYCVTGFFHQKMCG